MILNGVDIKTLPRLINMLLFLIFITSYVIYRYIYLFIFLKEYIDTYMNVILRNYENTFLMAVTSPCRHNLNSSVELVKYQRTSWHIHSSLLSLKVYFRMKQIGRSKFIYFSFGVLFISLLSVELKHLSQPSNTIKPHLIVIFIGLGNWTSVHILLTSVHSS